MKKTLPKISIITPSYNQGEYIEKTIQSILSQGYPNLEYIVMDGGSTDNTLSILKKYADKIDWVSHKDKGQSDAINKGLKKAVGDIVCYLNSDDYLENGALNRVGEYFLRHQNCFWLTGKCHIVDGNGHKVRGFVTNYKNLFLKHIRSHWLFYVIQYISQPATFWRKKATEEIGFFDQKLTYDMDYDYWLRIWQKYPPDFINEYLAYYRVHPSSKAMVSPETQFQVAHEIIQRYTKSKILLNLHKLHANTALILYRKLLIK